MEKSSQASDQDFVKIFFNELLEEFLEQNFGKTKVEWSSVGIIVWILKKPDWTTEVIQKKSWKIQETYEKNIQRLSCKTFCRNYPRNPWRNSRNNKEIYWILPEEMQWGSSEGILGVKNSRKKLWLDYLRNNLEKLFKKF